MFPCNYVYQRSPFLHLPHHRPSMSRRIETTDSLTHRAILIAIRSSRIGRQRRRRRQQSQEMELERRSCVTIGMYIMLALCYFYHLSGLSLQYGAIAVIVASTTTRGDEFECVVVVIILLPYRYLLYVYRSIEFFDFSYSQCLHVVSTYCSTTLVTVHSVPKPGPNSEKTTNYSTCCTIIPGFQNIAQMRRKQNDCEMLLV
jgi:hypothetical protein